MTHSSTEDQARAEYAAWERQQEARRHRAFHMLFLIGALVGVVYLYGALFPNLAQRKDTPQFYWPEPTPYVVETHTEYKFFSDNKLCIGGTVQC